MDTKKRRFNYKNRFLIHGIPITASLVLLMTGGACGLTPNLPLGSYGTTTNTAGDSASGNSNSGSSSTSGSGGSSSGSSSISTGSGSSAATATTTSSASGPACIITSPGASGSISGSAVNLVISYPTAYPPTTVYYCMGNGSPYCEYEIAQTSTSPFSATLNSTYFGNGTWVLSVFTVDGEGYHPNLCSTMINVSN